MTEREVVVHDRYQNALELSKSAHDFMLKWGATLEARQLAKGAIQALDEVIHEKAIL